MGNCQENTESEGKVVSPCLLVGNFLEISVILVERGRHPPKEDLLSKCKQNGTLHSVFRTSPVSVS